MCVHVPINPQHQVCSWHLAGMPAFEEGKQEGRKMTLKLRKPVLHKETGVYITE